MLNKESNLLYVFAAKPWKAFTARELKAEYGKNSNSYIDMFLSKYTKEDILSIEQVGNLNTYSLNTKSAKARIYAGAVLEVHAWSQKNLPYKDIERTVEKIPYFSHITIITGSYAKGTQTMESDIDIVMIIEDSCDPKKVRASLSMHCQLNVPYIHLYVFRHSEFIEMLNIRKNNYGKEIVKDCLVLTQGQIYLKLIDIAMENGFRDPDGKGRK